MPIIKTAKELAAAYKKVRTTADFVKELKTLGYSFSESIRKRLDTAEAQKILTSSVRQTLIRRTKADTLGEFVAGPLPMTIKAFAEKYHHLTIGIRLDVVNLVLEGLYDTLVIPRAINLGAYLSEENQNALFDLIRDNFTGFPNETNLKLGAFYLTAPPSVSPYGGSEYIIINQRFSWGFDAVTLSGEVENVTNIEGSIRFGMQLGAEIENDLLVLSYEPIPGPDQLIESLKLNIDVIATSPLQPTNSESLEAIESNLIIIGFNNVLENIAQTYSVCPTIEIPKFEEISITVQRVDIKLVETENGGHLMLGVLFGQNEFSYDFERLALLNINPFLEEQENIYIALHESLFQSIIDPMLESGLLERLVQKEMGTNNIKVRNLRVDFQQDIFPVAPQSQNGICIYVEATAIDACGAFGYNFKDVDVSGCFTFWLRGVEDGKIVMDEVASVGAGDADLTDLLICALLTALDFRLLLLGPWSLLFLAEFFLGPHSTNSYSFKTIFNPRIPVPGTELLPKIEITKARIDDQSMKVRGTISLIPDKVNTYVYLDIVQGNGQTMEPVAGAKILMMDQDVPKVSGDDIRIPKTGMKVESGEKVIKIVQTSFRPLNNGDDLLAEGITDEQGKALLILSPADISTEVGYLETQVTLNRLDIDKTEITKTEQAILEKQPDVYFQIVLPNGNTVDTRTLTPPFFIPNLKEKHIGTPENPLRLVLPA